MYVNCNKYISPFSKQLLLIIVALFSSVIAVNSQTKVFPGADERSPSRAQFFTWINNLNEGTTEKQTTINLNFFNWLKRRYGMQLDIYAFDAGAIDGAKFYGNIYSSRFKKQFPNGFDVNYKQAKAMKTRLGVWGGPDGFGNTPAEEKARIDQMVKLCKDYEFALFKFDAVCGPLRPEKEDAFIKMMTESRKYSPDLILLNHRLGLTKSLPHATTFLWGGQETYVDAHIYNTTTATHHRQGNLLRGLPPGMKRLTEDHGVCISSCLDNWDDDLVLQAFNRNLILAPEIYGNPWLLKDDEMPKLARIFNLHRQYRDIMTDGLLLPEKQYGPYAVARGNDKTRIITLRNLNWEPVTYQVKLDASIGLVANKKIQLRQWHPVENVIGDYDAGTTVDVTVLPFRTCLLVASTEIMEEPAIKGNPYKIITNTDNLPLEINLVGMPGTKSRIELLPGAGKYVSCTIDKMPANELLLGKSIEVSFEGPKLQEPTHRKLITLQPTALPADAAALYEATCYAADNNAMEVRSLLRSGKTEVPEIRAARDAFFKQAIFTEKGIWDKNLFDNNNGTFYFESKRSNRNYNINGGCLRLDLGKQTAIDKLIIEVPHNNYALLPMDQEEGCYVEVSSDLVNWELITTMVGYKIEIPIHKNIRYVRMQEFPSLIAEIKGYKNGAEVDRSLWKASNLFAHPNKMVAKEAWAGSFIAREITGNSYLCVAINGNHGVEGAYAALKIDGQLVGSPDRATSYPSNAWETPTVKSDKNYTYYFPLSKEYEGKKIEVVVLGYMNNKPTLNIEVWQTVSNQPFVEKKLIIERKR